MRNNYRKLKTGLLFRTLSISLLALVVGYFLLKFFIDGIFQKSFPALAIKLFMKFGMEYEAANQLYGRIFMDNKGLFLGIGFVLLFIFFFYIAISKLTRYLDDIGKEIENILSDSDAPVTLVPELKPLAEKLTTLKMTLKRRENAAIESEQRKNDLVVYLAHDLKTPLTSVIAYLTMLDEQPDMGAEEKTKYIHISLEKATRLGELISEFFEITRFNLQDIVLERDILDLSMMLEQLADESYAVLNEKDLTCSIQTDEGLLVNGDPDKLARVFDNLLRNAVAYCYRGTNIDIQAHSSMGNAVISFTNQGEPIPPQKLASIFEKFYRLDNARSSQTGGAGLGLSIAKEIVELHGGSIRAESDIGGIRFTVQLPLYQKMDMKKRGKAAGKAAAKGGVNNDKGKQELRK